MKTSDFFSVIRKTACFVIVLTLITAGAAADEIETLEEMLTSSPDSSDINLKLGRAYQQEGLFYKAERTLKKAIELDESNETAYLFLGELYYNKAQYLNASKYFKQAIDINESAAYYNYYADALSKNNKVKPAIAAYKKAIELDPANPVFYYGLGFLYRKAEMNKEYGEIYLKLHKMDMEMARSLKNNTELFLFNSGTLRKTSK